MLFMKWIGLTGSIATGKSTVSRLIESRDIPVVDADQISHQLTKVGEEGYEKIVSHFGTDFIRSDLQLDRKKISELVFSNARAKEELESILHPLIKLEVEKKKKDHQKNGAKICFYDVPLLFEKQLQNDFDKVVMVWCDPPLQKERLMLRNRISEPEAIILLSQQWPMSYKISHADYCLDNSGDEINLIKLVDHLILELQKV